MATDPRTPDPFFERPRPESPYDPARLQQILDAGRTVREGILEILALLNPYIPRQANDSVGNSFLLPVQEIGTTTSPAPGQVPFSISTFRDADDLERWLPTSAPLMAYDGEFYFKVFDPVMGGTPVSTFTEETAPAVPPGGIAAFLAIQFSPPTSRTTPCKVNSVEVLLQDPADPIPNDSLSAGIEPGTGPVGLVYRPWFVLSAEVDGRRTLTYKTLGYAHFWLFLDTAVPDSSSSSSDSSSDGSPPHNACFRLPGRRGAAIEWATWGMILRRRPTLRMTLTVPLYPQQPIDLQRSTTIPSTFRQCCRPGSIRVVHAALAGPAVVTTKIVADLCVVFEVHVVPRRWGCRPKSVTITLEGQQIDTPDQDIDTDEAGFVHNQAFWNTLP